MSWGRFFAPTKPATVANPRLIGTLDSQTASLSDKLDQIEVRESDETTNRRKRERWKMTRIGSFKREQTVLIPLVELKEEGKN